MAVLAMGMRFEHQSASSGKPHYLSYATARAVADDGLLEVWNGATSAGRVLRLNKDGQLQLQQGAVGAPTLAPEGDKDTGVYFVTATPEVAVAVAGTKRLSVVAAGVAVTGTLSSSGTLTTPRIDPTAGAGLGINAAAVDYHLVRVEGSFTSLGAQSFAAAVNVGVALTAHSGDTDSVSQIRVAGTITTPGTGATYTRIQTLGLAEPSITLGAGDSVTTAVTLYIAGAPTEGTANYYSIFVDSGNVRLDGPVYFGTEASPFTSDGAPLGSTTLMWSDLFLASGAVINFNNGNLTLTHSAATLTASGTLSAATLTSTGNLNVPSGGDFYVGGTTWGLLFDAGFRTIVRSPGEVLFISDSDASDSAGAFRWGWNGATQAAYTSIMQLTEGTSALSPSTSDGLALGTSTLMWSDVFLASGAVINFNNGDVTITHSANQLNFAGASSGYQFAEVVRPSANDSAALGTTAVGWSDLHLATGALINVANGNAVITHSSGIFTVSTGDWRVTTAGTNAASAVTVGGAQTLTNKILTAATITTSLAPTASDGAALGSTTLMFSDLFLASGAVINFNNGDVTLTHSANTLSLAGGTFIADAISSNGAIVTLGTVTIGTPSNGDVTLGLTIHQGTADDQILALQSDDVAHGLTSQANGETFFFASKSEPTLGGVRLVSLCEDSVTAGAVLSLEAYGGQADTAKTGAARGLVEVYAAEHNGAGSLANVTADGNVFVIRARRGGSDVALVIVDEDGDWLLDGAATTFDTYDDAALVRALSLVTTPDKVIRSQWDEFVRYGAEDLVEAGILGDLPENGGLWNVTQTVRLLVGACWQQECRINELEQKLLQA